MLIFEQQSVPLAETGTMLPVCTQSTILASSSLLGGLAANTVNMLAGETVDNAIDRGAEINPLSPESSDLLKARGIGLAAETVTLSVTHNIEQAIGQLAAGEAAVSGADLLSTTASVAAVVGLVKAAAWTEEQATTWLLQHGLLNKPGRRSELSTAGKVYRFLLREGLQFGAILLGLSIAGDTGFFGASLGLAGQALMVSLSLDLGRELGQRLLPKTFAARQTRHEKQRELKVYRGYRPMKLSPKRRERQRWIDFAQELNALFQGPVSPDIIHSDKHQLRVIKRARSRTDPLHGLIFWAADTQPIGRQQRREPLSLITHYFSPAEQQGYFMERIAALKDHPEEQIRKLTNWIEIKRALWQYLTDQAPECGDTLWSPQDIEIFPDPDTGLAQFQLSEPLERIRQARNIGDIRLSFTDVGRLSLGLLSIRAAHQTPHLLGLGIDLADARVFWRHEEGWWGPGDPKIYFPKDRYQELFPGDTRPSAHQMAERHAISEAIFKALYPHHPDARHNMWMYREFNAPLETERWHRLELSGGSLAGLRQWQAHHAEGIVHRAGDAIVSVVALRSDPEYTEPPDQKS